MHHSTPTALLQSKSILFWDFDGVIKDSVEVKMEAYYSLFLPYGMEVVERVSLHHHANSGVSRFAKIPLYLSWAGEEVTPPRIKLFCERFSELTLQAVIDSPWVPGVREYLLRFFNLQYFVLVTATPRQEMERILSALALNLCFREVFGAPVSKVDAISSVLRRLCCHPSKAILIGDSDVDLRAAQENSVPFLLRRTRFNLSLQQSHCGPTFQELIDEPT